MSTTHTTSTDDTTAVPRRSVARGAAWAIPAVAVSAAAPAIAASPTCSSLVTLTSASSGTLAVGISTTRLGVRFTITANADIQIGSTFTYTLTGLGLPLGSSTDGTMSTYATSTSAGGVVTYTTTRVIPAGTQVTLNWYYDARVPITGGYVPILEAVGAQSRLCPTNINGKTTNCQCASRTITSHVPPLAAWICG